MNKLCFYALLAFAGLVSGCATIFSKSEGDDWGHLYSGVYCDLGLAGAAIDEGESSLSIFTPLAIIDLPLSVVADTVVVPFDLYYAHKERERRQQLGTSTPMDYKWEASCMKMKLF